MLNDDQKNLIEADERFRCEVRHKLVSGASVLGEQLASSKEEIESDTKKVRSKIMTFLNSSIGIWFLTSVVVTGGAGLYQQMEHYYDAKKTAKYELRKYKFEVEARLDQLKIGSAKAKTVGDAKKALTSLYYNKYPLNPELQNRGLGSIYASAYDLLSGDFQERTKQGIAVIRQLEKLEIKLSALPDDQALSPDDKAELNKLIQTLEQMHHKQEDFKP